MRPIEIITDGSYVKGTIGVGCVRANFQENGELDDFKADSYVLKLQQQSHYGSQAAEAEAVIFALDSLNEEGYTGDVIIYYDLIDLVKYINGHENRVDDSIQENMHRISIQKIEILNNVKLSVHRDPSLDLAKNSNNNYIFLSY